MGNSYFRQNSQMLASQDPKQFLQNDIPRFIISDLISRGKFIKTFHGKIDGNNVIVKVYFRNCDDDLSDIAKKLTLISKKLSPAKYPCLLPYQIWLKSNNKVTRSNTSPTYLIRQYFFHNLYERLSTRPFLHDIEKRFIIFQLMKCLEICHREGICHGDINPDNIMITSWNWIVLTDFSPYKPTKLPENDPADFQYFFDSMNRKRCYIAPERFYERSSSSQIQSMPNDIDNMSFTSKVNQAGESFLEVECDNDQNPLNFAMDIYSLGCTIAEIFLNGEPLLDLSSSLKYVSASSSIENLSQEDCNVTSNIHRLKDEDIKTLVSHMVQRNPSYRRSVKDYREDFESSGSFPDYFSGVLYDLFLKIHWEGHTPDDRLRIVCEQYGDILLHIADSVADSDDYMLVPFFSNLLADISIDLLKKQPLFTNQTTPGSQQAAEPRKSIYTPSFNPKINAKKADVKKQASIEELAEECRKLLDYIQSESAPIPENENLNTSSEGSSGGSFNFDDLLENLNCISKNEPRKLYDPLSSGIRSKGVFDITAAPAETTQGSSGLLLVVEIICSNLRHLLYPRSKIAALLLLVRLGRCCEDSIILQRVVPYVVLLLKDNNSSVRATAVRTLRALLSVVETFNSVETNLFSLYIFPSLKGIAKDSESVVRIAFAESIASFAESAKRFLDKTHLIQMKKVISDEMTKESPSSVVHEISGLIDTPETRSRSQSQSHSPAAPGGSPIPLFVDSTYDAKLKQLQETINYWIRDLVLDSSIVDQRKGSGLSSQSSMVKRVLLADILKLCVFFGQEGTQDHLLLNLLTFLNDQDWELRYAFCTKIPSVCLFVGPAFTSKCILPLTLNAIYDVEEMVVARAVSCLSSLIDLALLPHSIAVDVFKTVSPLLIHPSSPVRREAIRFVCVVAKLIGEIDSYVFLIPVISKLLNCNFLGVQFTEKNLELALKPGLSKPIYRKALHNRLHATSSSNNRAANEELLVDLNIDSMRNSSPTPSPTPSARKSMQVSKEPSTDESLSLEDQEKLDFMIPYINIAASEISSKYIQVQKKNSMVSSISMDANFAAVLKRNLSLAAPQEFGAKSVPLLAANLEKLLEVSATSLPDPHSLFVPGQKLGLNRPLSEEKKIPLLKIENVDSNKLKTYFSITNSLADTNRMFEEEENQVADYKIFSPSSETVVTVNRIKGLTIPPLSPDFGSLTQPDGRFYNMYTEPLELGSQQEMQSRSQWRPRENLIVANLSEHTASVNRLAVSRDQSFFASASDDKTVKVWQINTLDKSAFIKSAITYEQHKSPVNDVCILENTHTIASCSENGTILVWKVELGIQKKVGTSATNGSDDAGGNNNGVLTVLGNSQLKKIDPLEGSINNIQHFNSDSASVLVYTTQKGHIHGWDLRSSGECFNYKVRPELGSLVTLALAHDRNWIVAGTSRGYIGLWDVRYNVMNKLWRHSSNGPIRRLACCKSIPKTRGDIMQYTDGSYLFAAAGNNEAAVWGIPEGGECYKCFRSLSMAQAYDKIDGLPILHDVPLPAHPSGVITSALLSHLHPVENKEHHHSVRAIMGRISHTGLSYLVTAGSDKSIRFWDFMSPNRCLTISGLEPSQPKSCFETPSIEGLYGKLYMCLDSTIPSPNTMLKAQVPIRENRGPLSVVSNYKDTILDLKSIDLPTRMVLSCGKDGDIKLWR